MKIKAYINKNKKPMMIPVNNTHYWKYADTATLINDDGVVQTKAGSNGWQIYYTQNGDNTNELAYCLSATISPTYPRWQSPTPNVRACFKTPQKGIITSYVTTQWWDDSNSGRMCTNWIITGYENEVDCLAGTNGTVIDNSTWSVSSKGATKTVDLSINTNAFEYYSLTMVRNSSGNSSYTSIGNTKFYMRLPEECTAEDEYVYITETTTYKTFYR